MLFALLNPPHGSSFVFLVIAFVPPAKTKNPTAAVLGSPANSLGSPLSSFLLPAHGSQLKTKKPPKAQRKRHVSFRLLRHLPGHGLGRTRRQLALRSLRSGRKPFVPHSLHPPPQRLLKAVFPAFPDPPVPLISS